MRELWKQNLVPFSRVTALERDAARLEGERGALIAGDRAGKRQDRRDRAADPPDRPGPAHRGRQGAGRDPRQDVRADRAPGRRRGPAEAHRHPGAAGRQGAPAHRPHGGRRHPGRRAGHADRARRRRADRRGARCRRTTSTRSISASRRSLRFAAFNQRTTPELDGEVIRIARRRHAGRAQASEPYYAVRIRVARRRARPARRRCSSCAGMPVEVFIQTTPRTVASFLVKPLGDQSSPGRSGALAPCLSQPIEGSHGFSSNGSPE